jgi:hypothetical protein
MTTATVSAEIARFAEQVRAELADLSADDLDDLTDGLEADLAESLEEDPTRQLPDPVAYAIELRTAAGLPPEPEPEPEPEPGRGLRGAVRGMTSGLRATRHQVAESLRAHPVTAGMLSFLESLRPAWWVLRAWVAYQLVTVFFGSEGPVLPYEAGWWLVLLVLVVMSVQWGRGRWRNVWGLTPLIILGNVVAAVALLPLFAATHAWSAPFDEEPYFEQSPDHTDLVMHGKPVSNIYAYGPDGKSLRGTQLFDQDGSPFDLPRDSIFDVCPDGSCDEQKPEPARLETGESAWNVYPRTLVPMTYNEMGELVPGKPGDKQAQEPPFVKVPKVVDRAERVE